MQTRWHSENDEWALDGLKITSEENREAIRMALEQGPIIVEHWLYRGASAPNRLIFDDFDNFEEYLATKCFAGDAIDIWNFAELCRADNTIATGKCPTDDGYIPRKGAY